MIATEKLWPWKLLLAAILHSQKGGQLTLPPAFGDTKSFEDKPHGAFLRKTELQQVEAHEGSEKQPIFTVKYRACLNSQGETDENEKAGDCVNPVGDNHGTALVVVVGC